MQRKHGEQEFNIMPKTYVLPSQAEAFEEQYKALKNSYHENMWIVKPTCGACGRGIYVTDDINDIDMKSSNVVSHYVSNPLLINGFKFDLRIYVCITSYEPLRIYVYKEGLVRFASEQYEVFNEAEIQEELEGKNLSNTLYNYI